MERTEGLKEYVRTEKYRRSLDLPPQVTEEYRLLAQGEYNRNYVFTHPLTGKKLVLRINFGSQMHLEHQIEYEYKALELLRSSGRTPQPLYVDGSKTKLPFGVMVMEYLPGHAMDYPTELFRGAACLADIHSVRLPEAHSLITPDNPLRMILEECEQMVRTYMEFPEANERKKKTIRALLHRAWEMADSLPPAPYRCCVNTELNSTNFLINWEGERDYLIDWEKPVCSEPAQDLGHFLAPTTTFWKTDVILDRQVMREFTETYIHQVNDRFPVENLWDRVSVYLPVTCLRGITWCAMAWVEYQQPEKEIFNETTWRKLEEYLSDEFLERIRRFVG